MTKPFDSSNTQFTTNETEIDDFLYSYFYNLSLF